MGPENIDRKVKGVEEQKKKKRKIEKGRVRKGKGVTPRKTFEVYPPWKNIRKLTEKVGTLKNGRERQRERRRTKCFGVCLKLDMSKIMDSSHNLLNRDRGATATFWSSPSF